MKYLSAPMIALSATQLSFSQVQLETMLYMIRSWLSC